MAEHRFERGGQDDGTLTVSIERFYGDDCVVLKPEPFGSWIHLTPDQARAVAADLLAHADELDRRQ